MFSPEELPMKKLILVIEDDTSILDAIRAMFEDMGHEVRIATDPVLGTVDAIAGEFDVIVTDARMLRRSGAEVTERVLARRPGARIVVITTIPEDPLAGRALRAGAIGVLEEPFDPEKARELIG
jgi:DNA-binding NtrC family response regulator